MSELRDSPDKCVALQWSKDVNREFNSELRIEVINQRGMLAEIAREATLSEANIDNITISDKDAHHAVISLTLEVKNRVHLAQIIKRIRILTGVEKVTRLKN